MIVRRFSLKEENPNADVAESVDSRGGGNAAVANGTLGSTIEKILADLKPEAVYFFADDNGERSGSVVFDMKDPSQIPGVAGAMVSRVQRQSLFATGYDAAGSGQSRPVARQGCQTIRKVGSSLSQLDAGRARRRDGFAAGYAIP
jgi:hypothetical protein